MTRTIKPISLLRTLAASVALFLAGAAPAPADTVTLKDGSVLDGKVSREGDGFIYFLVKVGGVEHSRLILRTDIVKLVRDADAPAPAANPAAKEAPAAPEAAKTESAPATAPKPAPDSTRSARTGSSTVSKDGAMKIAFITLEEEVGPFLNAKALEESVKLLEKDPPDVVVLRFNSGGGAASELKPLSDTIEQKLKPKYTVVAWIESAISAAAMSALTCEDIYFLKEGNFGGCVGFRMTGERTAKAMDGEELEKILRFMETVSKRGDHDPLIMRAMQVPTDLSCDIDEATGKVTWRNDLKGKYVVSTEAGSRILTLNSIDAIKFKFGRAICDNKDELAKALGANEWVEVCPEADAYQEEFRKNVKEAQVKINELGEKMDIAIKFGQVPRARSFLGEIRTWVHKAPSLEDFMGLTPERFREIEEQLRKIQEQQQAQKPKSK